MYLFGTQMKKIVWPKVILYVKISAQRIIGQLSYINKFLFTLAIYLPVNTTLRKVLLYTAPSHAVKCRCRIVAFTQARKYR